MTLIFYDLLRFKKSYFIIKTIKICVPFFFFHLFFIPFLFSQSHAEDTLKFLREEVVKSNIDSARTKANDAFIFTLEKILRAEESFKNNFDSVKYTAFLRSPDNAFRIINWNLPFDDETNKYFCYIQISNKKKKNYQWFKLIDKSEEISSPENIDRKSVV